jgi:four helix bundle protein
VEESVMQNAPSAATWEGRAHYSLDAWKVSRQFVSDVYRITQRFPKEEVFGLTSQLRRAAVSIPSNIAEGAARSGSREFAQYSEIARGSLSELETQLLIAGELGYISVEHPIYQTVDRVSKLIAGLHKRITHNP